MIAWGGWSSPFRFYWQGVTLSDSTVVCLGRVYEALKPWRFQVLQGVGATTLKLLPFANRDCTGYNIYFYTTMLRSTTIILFSLCHRFTRPPYRLLDKFNKGNSSPVGSGFSLDNSSSSHWSEAGGPAPRTESPRPHSPATATATAEEAFHGQAGETRSDRRVEFEVHTAAPTAKGEGTGADRGRSNDAGGARNNNFEGYWCGDGVAGDDGDNRNKSRHGGRSDSTGPDALVPRGGEGRGSDGPGGRQARMADGVATAEVLSREDGTTGVPLSMRSPQEPSVLVGYGTLDADQAAPVAGRRDRERHSSKGGVFVAGPERTGASDAVGDEWARAGSDGLGSRTPISGSGERVEGSSESEEGELSAAGGQQALAGTPPRLVMVSVKPSKSDKTAPASASPPPLEQSSPASPQQQFRRGGNDGNDAGFPSRDDATKKSFSSAMPRVANDARHEEDGRRGKTAAAGDTAVGGDDDYPSGKTVVGANGRASGGNRSTSATPAASSVIVDASRLGLEGDEFPDVSEFDLDGISEIDAGGEWAGSVGGSLSS